MGIKLVVAVTDDAWYEVLRSRPGLDEINFWAPSVGNFRALQPGELLLFKLHAPRNVIAGFGVFVYASLLPCSLAWEAFREGNGALSLQQMRAQIVKYRRTSLADRTDFPIGCRILTQPVFFDESDWFPVPENWSKNIVSFKTYDTDDADGMMLWNALSERQLIQPIDTISKEDSRYGAPQIVRPRLGQGAFRVLVTETYHRRCAVTQEKTLPALDAAHIRPYSEGGSHEVANGLLLRRDIHSLFDSGYVTITPDYRFEDSPKIREEYENGRHYYALQGAQVLVPDTADNRPDPKALSWHNEHCFRG